MTSFRVTTLQDHARAVTSILEERRRQVGDFDASHDPHVWIAKIVKHLGRAVTTDPRVFRRSMVIVGALAVAAIEWYDSRYPT